jgi:hypothetical protein
MNREQELLITKTPTHYRDLNPGPLVSLSGPQTIRPRRLTDHNAVTRTTTISIKANKTDSSRMDLDDRKWIAPSSINHYYIHTNIHTTHALSTKG